MKPDVTAIKSKEQSLVEKRQKKMQEAFSEAEEKCVVASFFFVCDFSLCCCQPGNYNLEFEVHPFQQVAFLSLGILSAEFQADSRSAVKWKDITEAATSSQ